MSAAERRALLAAEKAERALTLPPTEPELVDVEGIEDDPRRLRRRIDEDAVAGLMASMAEIGLKTPIVVRHFEDRPSALYGTDDSMFLVSGGNRLEAARRLGWKRIGAVVLSKSDDDRDVRLWEIAENLHRAELTPLERSEHVEEWRRLHGEKPAHLAPVSEKGGRGNRGGTREAARALGIERTEVQRAVKIAGLAPEAKQAARDLGLDRKQGALLDAAREPSAERQVARLRERADKPAGAPAAPTPAPARAQADEIRDLKGKLAEKNDQLRQIKGQKKAVDDFNNRLSDDVSRKSSEAIRLSDALDDAKEEIRRLTQADSPFMAPEPDERELAMTSPAWMAQVAVDSLHSAVKQSGARDFVASQLRHAIEKRVWDQKRVSPNGMAIAPLSFRDFVHERYPVGIGSSFAFVERLLLDDAGAFALFVRERGGTPEECRGPEIAALAIARALVDHLSADTLATVQNALRSTTAEHIATALFGLAGDAP